MEIEIKLKNRLFNLHVFENYPIDVIKQMLLHDPLRMLEEIERLEELTKEKGYPPKIGEFFT